MSRSSPIHTLPAGYAQARYWELNTVKLILFNMLAVVPLAAAAALMLIWLLLIGRVRHASFSTGGDFPLWGGFVILMAVLPLHEWLHGLAIQYMGHRPRYGWKPKKLVLYATADGALFRRNEYVVVALAPLVGITLLGLALTAIFFGSAFAFYIALAVIFNAASSIGDLWMLGIVLRHPANALVRDEADSIRVYARV